MMRLWNTFVMVEQGSYCLQEAQVLQAFYGPQPPADTALRCLQADY